MRFPFWFGCVLSAQQQTTLEALARRRNITKSEVVRRLLDTQAVRLGLAVAEDDDMTLASVGLADDRPST